MKVNKVAAGISAVFLSTFWISCSAGLLPEMERVLGDPEVTPPAVVSFKSEDRIEVSWDYDPCADEYILSRSRDMETPVYSTVYRGSSLGFSDDNVETGYRYLYTLTKVRGQRLFGPSGAVLGAADGVVADDLEVNDAKETASGLLWDLQANMYYFQSYGDEKLIDRDWYRVTVPPRRKAMVVITQDSLSMGESSWITYALEEHPPFTVVNGNGIEIPNYTYETKVFCFMLSPKAGSFVNDLTKGGGGFISYTVSLDQLSGL